MKLFKLAKTFRTEEDGAVTVDWVVLTAAIVGLGIAVYGVVSGGIANLSGDIDTQLETDQINTSFPAAAPVD
ncbi:pilus assembly protein [Dinoroseobacter sp. S76]|uniref:pilus assembly protein n=1 Tax=Dinoroseobacter sp. S76 TaxID=3415124 RepID=UPI00315FEB95